MLEVHHILAQRFQPGEIEERVEAPADVPAFVAVIENNREDQRQWLRLAVQVRPPDLGQIQYSRKRNVPQTV